MHPIAVIKPKCGAGEVDKQLLARAVGLTHGSFKRAGILPIVLTELRVFVGTLLRALSDVLLPEQHQRHAFTTQFLMDIAVVW